MPRKTGGAELRKLLDNVASMRPRPDAAENSRESPSGFSLSDCFNEAAARCRGKRVHDGQTQGVLDASMRPRPDAAENRCVDHLRDGAPIASMRPRPDAAENPPSF